MSNFNKQFFTRHGLFLLLLLGFVISKMTHLDIPYFWDESWVYAPAVNIMSELGPTLNPASFPLEHSRGHPLFFHWLGGIWIKIFGNSLTSLHAFALTIATGFILSLYAVITKLISKETALATIAILIFQPLFYGQSSMVLPELLLTFLCFVSLWALFERRWLTYFIVGSLAIWTKESAVAFIGCLFAAEILRQIKNQSFEAKALGLSLIPLFSFLLFLLINKLSFDFYLYPEHTGMISFEFSEIYGKLKAIFKNVLVDQKRMIMSLFAFGGSIFLFARNDKLFRQDCLIYLIVPIIGFSLFSEINFYTVRYILVIFPLVLVLIAWVICELLKEQRTWLLLVTAAILTHSIIQLFDRRSVRDIDLSYLDYGPTQLAAISYMEENNLYQESIHTGFLPSTALTNKYAGYRNTPKKFASVNNEMNPVRNYFIFSSLEPHHHRDKVMNDSRSKLLQKFEKGKVIFEIYILDGSL